jgi:hypothetical protein
VKQGLTMSFLLRVAFWLGVVLVLLPTGGSQPVPQSQVSAGEAFSAAKAAVSDMQHFCERQPNVCEVGSQTAVTLGQRAQVGAKMLYEFLQEWIGEESKPTGSLPPATAKSSQQTLRPADLSPPWRGPSRDGSRPAKANPT